MQISLSGEVKGQCSNSATTLNTPRALRSSVSIVNTTVLSISQGGGVTRFTVSDVEVEEVKGRFSKPEVRNVYIYINANMMCILFILDIRTMPTMF